MPPYFLAKSAIRNGMSDKFVGRVYNVPINGNGTGPGGKLEIQNF